MSKVNDYVLLNHILEQQRLERERNNRHVRNSMDAKRIAKEAVDELNRQYAPTPPSPELSRKDRILLAGTPENDLLVATEKKYQESQRRYLSTHVRSLDDQHALAELKLMYDHACDTDVRHSWYDAAFASELRRIATTDDSAFDMSVEAICGRGARFVHMSSTLARDVLAFREQLNASVPDYIDRERTVKATYRRAMPAMSDHDAASVRCECIDPLAERSRSLYEQAGRLDAYAQTLPASTEVKAGMPCREAASARAHDALDALDRSYLGASHTRANIIDDLCERSDGSPVQTFVMSELDASAYNADAALVDCSGDIGADGPEL